MITGLDYWTTGLDYWTHPNCKYTYKVTFLTLLPTASVEVKGHKYIY